MIFIILSITLFVFIFLLFIYKISKNKKFLEIYSSLTLLMLLPIFILSIFSFNLVGPSKTEDFKNYLKFDKGINDMYSKSINYFFPKDINENEVINYYYFYNFSWDLNFEINLEIKVSEEKFNNLINKFKDEYDYSQKNAFYNSDYIELIANEKFSFYNIDSKYTTFAFVEKLIYNEITKTIIYEYLHVEGLFYFEEIYYFNRFKIDYIDYNNYINNENNI